MVQAQKNGHQLDLEIALLSSSLSFILSFFHPSASFRLRLPSASYLFGFQSQLDEDLLQLLVDKVDAELLEAVVLEDLEAVDIQNADAVGVRRRLHGRVDPLNSSQNQIPNEYHTAPAPSGPYFNQPGRDNQTSD